MSPRRPQRRDFSDNRFAKTQRGNSVSRRGYRCSAPARFCGHAVGEDDATGGIRRAILLEGHAGHGPRCFRRWRSCSPGSGPDGLDEVTSSIPRHHRSGHSVPCSWSMSPSHLPTRGAFIRETAWSCLGRRVDRVDGTVERPGCVTRSPALRRWCSAVWTVDGRLNIAGERHQCCLAKSL